MKKIVLSLLLLLVGCAVAPPSGVAPVKSFELDRYLGKWYEIARLDHSFERGLSNVSATYGAREDGGVQVVNRGYDDRAGVWKQVEGRAYFLGEPSVGSLKVSFFGPFYGGYHIVALDKVDYSYAMISGPNRNYLWILARERELPPALLNDLLAQARALGFATDQLIMVEQDREDA